MFQRYFKYAVTRRLWIQQTIIIVREVNFTFDTCKKFYAAQNWVLGKITVTNQKVKNWWVMADLGAYTKVWSDKLQTKR